MAEKVHDIETSDRSLRNDLASESILDIICDIPSSGSTGKMTSSKDMEPLLWDPVQKLPGVINSVVSIASILSEVPFCC